jgi:hypothetical protein
MSREPGCVPDGLFEFRPSQQIARAGLQKIRLGLVAGGSGLYSFGRQGALSLIPPEAGCILGGVGRPEVVDACVLVRCKDAAAIEGIYF